MKDRATIFRTTAGVFLVFLIAAVQVPFPARTAPAEVTFSKIKTLQCNGKVFKTRSASITFRSEDLFIRVPKGTDFTMNCDDIVSAEYSYSKKPRWKTGLALGAAGILFPPLWIVALPLGFTKHRKHWLTVRTTKDFAVIKIRKGNRKILIPTFETRSGMTVVSVGEVK